MSRNLKLVPPGKLSEGRKIMSLAGPPLLPGKKVLTVRLSQNDPLDSSSQIDQVDSENKDMG